jgi:hypothetical protein
METNCITLLKNYFKDECYRSYPDEVVTDGRVILVGIGNILNENLKEIAEFAQASNISFIYLPECETKEHVKYLRSKIYTFFINNAPI